MFGMTAMFYGQQCFLGFKTLNLEFRVLFFLEGCKGCKGRVGIRDEGPEPNSDLRFPHQIFVIFEKNHEMLI